MTASRAGVVTLVGLGLAAGCSLVNAPDDVKAGAGGANASGSGGGATTGTSTTTSATTSSTTATTSTSSTTGSGGAGGSMCPDGTADCDGDPGNGCEKLDTTDHCGSCQTTCAAGDMHVTTPLCSMGACDYDVCAAGFGDCNQDRKDGCETSLDAIADCGACGSVCAPANAGGATCAGGKCGYAACQPGFLDCDGDTSNGCEVKGNQCLYWASGVLQNVSPATLSGWQLCYQGTYEKDMGTLMPTVLQQCSKAKLLLACRKVAAPAFQLAAMGARADVLFDCGTDPACTHQANGVGWYWSNGYSWGFANAGDAVTRSQCDVAAGPLRLCWHTLNQNVGGYRCGDDTGLNSDATWERDIYQAD